MVSKVVVIDPSISGISGDMILASLIDLGVDTKFLEELRRAIIKNVDGVKDLEISVKDVVKGGVKAKSVDVKIDEDHSERRGAEMLRYVENVATEIGLGERAKRFAVDVIKTIIDAEMKVHGTSFDSVHFHELGSADTIVDVVGVARALEALNLFDAKIYSLPIAVGKGYVETEHGLYPIPPPATLEILRSKGAKFFSGFAEGELATPTGVAIVCNLANSFIDSLPVLKILGVGYGAGKKDFEKHPNIVRVMVGEDTDNVDELEWFERERIAVIETDVDDVSGEVVGYTMEKLFEVGAKDVSVIPIYMKKNRPGHSIRVLADVSTYPIIVETLIRELGTLGVRVSFVDRFKVPYREVRKVDIEINGQLRQVEVKVSRDYKGKIINIKPEYESVKRIARESNTTYRNVVDAAIKTFKENSRGEG
ncbi:MAG: nickel pincer cofactor biosynthesis protein LarC [Ignisphaera sp.]